METEVYGAVVLIKPEYTHLTPEQIRVTPLNSGSNQVYKVEFPCYPPLISRKFSSCPLINRSQEHTTFLRVAGAGLGPACIGFGAGYRLEEWLEGEEQNRGQRDWWYRQRGQVAAFNQEYEKAQWLLQRSLDIAAALPMQQNIAEALYCQAYLALATGDYELARSKVNQAQELFGKLSMYPQIPDTEGLIQVIEEAAITHTRPAFKGYL